MIALDNGDKIQGDASAATVVDYTLHGFVGTTATQLADGQLAAATGDLYTAGAAGIGVSSIILVNTDTSARTVNLYLTPSGGTARRLIPKDMTLAAGYSLITDGMKTTVINTEGEVLSGGAVISDAGVAITVESPTSSEDITIFFTNRAITITEMRAVLLGSSTPSVTWTIRHHATDRSNAGNEVVTGGTTTTSTTSGDDVTSFNDATIPADSFVWCETTAQSGTVTELHISIIFNVD